MIHKIRNLNGGYVKKQVQKEGPEKTKEKYSALSKEYLDMVDNMKQENPKMFHEMYCSHASTMNAKFAALSRITGRPPIRV